MSTTDILKIGVLIMSITSVCHQINGQEKIDETAMLSKKQESIALIAAFTAKGELDQLQQALNKGLDVGLTINEIKEVLVQLYAYCGFPRSLRGINTFMAVLEERKTKGINDQAGRNASPLPKDGNKYERGKKVIETLTGSSLDGPPTGYSAFSPEIDVFLKEHLFADIFGRDILNYTDREITTISALASMGGVEPMLQSHMSIGLNIGMKESQLRQILNLIESHVGKVEAEAGREVLSKILSTNTNSERREQQANVQQQKTPGPAAQTNNGIFVKGNRRLNENFTGYTWLEMLVTDTETFNTTVGNVTFEPGARTNWHKHPGGQILLVTQGTGYYQEKGKPIQVIKKGDVVTLSPGGEHWHGASPGSELTHIAISTNVEKGVVAWLGKVTDEEYYNFK